MQGSPGTELLFQPWPYILASATIGAAVVATPIAFKAIADRIVQKSVTEHAKSLDREAARLQAALTMSVTNYARYATERHNAISRLFAAIIESTAVAREDLALPPGSAQRTSAAGRAE